MQNSPHHKRPEEALEPLVELGGVREEQEECRQEFQQGDRHKSSRGGRREAHERHERQDLRGGEGKGSVKRKGKRHLLPRRSAFSAPELRL